jgi:hypothetical protein
MVIAVIHSFAELILAGEQGLIPQKGDVPRYARPIWRAGARVAGGADGHPST